MALATRQAAYDGQQSEYLNYLPAMYSQDYFLGRFLMIFESILGPVEGVIDNLPYYFDVALSPKELLPWLASWVDLVLDESWPLDRRRELVKSAVDLFKWRGTRRGLHEFLRVYTGVEAKIIEDFGGISLSGEAKLGWNTVLGNGEPHTISVILELAPTRSINVQQLRAIIEAEKPAHVNYHLQLIATNPQDEGAGADLESGVRLSG